MRALGRVVSAAIVVVLTSLAGACGGYGVDLHSGTNNPSQVAIAAPSGITTNPYPVEIGHTTSFDAYPSSGNYTNYGDAVPVVWNTNQPLLVTLLEPGCNPANAYGGEPTTSICVLAVAKGKATINATTGSAVGSIVVSVTI